MKKTINYYEKLMDLKEKLEKKDQMLCIWENDRFINSFIRDYKYSNWDIIKRCTMIDKKYYKWDYYEYIYKNLK